MLKAFRAGTLLALGLFCLAMATDASAQVALQLAPRTMKFEAGKIGTAGGGSLANYNLPPSEEYYMDYTVLFRPGFDWLPTNNRPRGGKLPGLAASNPSGGCNAIEKDGWSVRTTWNEYGEVTLFLYHQDRNNRCGAKTYLRESNGSAFRFTTGKRYRVTLRVRVNTPNRADGIAQVWIDGKMMLSRNDLRLRGAVGESTAKVAKLLYHSFFGGNTSAYAPAKDSYIEFGPMFVTRCMPNFGQAPGSCR